MKTQPLPELEVQEIIERFHRDGYAIIPNVFSSKECSHLRQLTDHIASRPECTPDENDYSFVVRNPQDESIEFAQIFIREPILSLVQQILGPECRFAGQNVIRNLPGQAVSQWHVDDCNKLEHPLPPEIPRWPAGARLPLIWLSVQVALTDIETLEDGPTEIVPGSHYSGRLTPNDNPTFEGQGVNPIFCQAGDIYLFNHQTWHRGAPNYGDKTRYLMQLQYGRGDSLAFRCQGADKTPALLKVLEDADPKLTQVMIGPPQYV